jgi:hypothetical protein
MRRQGVRFGVEIRSLACSEFHFISFYLGLTMAVADSKLVSSVETIEQSEAKAATSEVVTVALFSGLGLLLSLAVLITDLITPGDWF